MPNLLTNAVFENDKCLFCRYLMHVAICLLQVNTMTITVHRRFICHTFTCRTAGIFLFYFFYNKSLSMVHFMQSGNRDHCAQIY